MDSAETSFLILIGGIFVFPILLLICSIIFAILGFWLYLLFMKKITGTQVKNILLKPSKEMSDSKRARIGLTKMEMILTIVLSILLNPIAIWLIGFYYYKASWYLKKARQIREITLVIFLFEILFILIAIIIGQLINQSNMH